MRAHALPLQILLAIALVLNGIGGAMAGVLAELPAHATAADTVAPAPAEATAHGDCAGQAGGAPSAMDPDEAALAGHATAAASGCHSGGDSDCSDSPQCRQACMHACVAVTPLLVVHVVQPRVDVVLHRLDTGHPAPMLPSAFRPPIA